jgi:hypothetical protein
MRGLLLLTLITVGCGAKSTCVPGQSAACICSDGTGGAQLCKGDGTFAACQCASGATSPGVGDDMATGTGGNGNTGSGGDMATGGNHTGQKRVFVTSSAYAGSVAASVCQTVADSVSLGGTWIAWLSLSTAPTPDAINRVQGTGPWALLDGTVVFANHAQLATKPTALIDVFETGQKAPGALSVWTGTLTGGVHSGSDCNGWSSMGYYGDYGTTSSTASWTAAGGSAPSCSDVMHVYCFEQ